MRKRRITGRLLLAILLAGAGTALWLFQPRDRLLMSRAKRVADATDFYNWISNHEILRVKWPEEGPGPPLITRFDLETGPKPSVLVREDSMSAHAGCEYSPDGNWALCWKSNHPGAPITATSLQTRRSCSWPLPGDAYHYSPLWLADSRHWLTTTTVPDGYLILYDIERSGKSARLEFPDFRSVIWQDFVPAGSDRLFAIDRGFRATDILINGLDLTEFRLTTQVERLRHCSIRLPIKGELKEFKISPAGDRIAWVFYEERSPALAVWLHRFLRLVPVKSEPLFSLWITDIEGRHLREVGHIPIESPEESDQENLGIEWVPGGTQLSFVGNNNLYVVPAE